MEVSPASNPPSYWTVLEDSTAFPLGSGLAIRRVGDIVRARRDGPPKSLASESEAERCGLLGVAYTEILHGRREGKRTIVNEMALGIEPTFLRETSRADLAVFLAVLTEMFWSRGRRNIHMSKDLST